MNYHKYPFNRFLSLVVLLITLNAFAQTEVQPYRPGITSDGVTYFLPQTQIRVILRAERTLYIPGEFAAYAERFLDLSNVSTQASETWKLISTEHQVFGVANPTNAYTIALNPKSSAPLVELAPDGRLLAINREAQELPKLQEAQVQHETTKLPSAERFKTPEMLRAGSLTAKAEIAAQEIYDIRENRNLLIKGQAEFNPKDGEQLQAMLSQLDEQEQALLSLFEGTKQREIHTFVIDYAPKEDVKQHELLRFSSFLGFLEAGDLAGDAVWISVNDMKSLPPEELDPKAKKKAEHDLRYCNPSNATITIGKGDEQLSRFITPLSQFGRIEHLGGVLFNKKFSTKVLISPTTGGIEKIDLEQNNP